MRTFIPILALSLASIVAAAPPLCSAEEPPAWAYPMPSPDFKPRPDDGMVRRVPGSSATYSVSQVRDTFRAVVWHPDAHPPLPPIVAQGRKPNLCACGSCHREDGPGGPENASLAGLPAAYIVQQMADFKSSARKTSVPKRNVDSMIKLSQDITDAEVAEAAAYFSALQPRANIKVVETDTVPKTFAAGMFLAPLNNGEIEPLGQRIIEVTEDLEGFENRDPRAQFIAYVPMGSVAQGAVLVNTGGVGKTVPCAICHGPDLHGLGGLPSIAGRSPSYIVRQLYDMQHSLRAGTATQLMQGPVAHLTVEDMVAIAAYLASLPR